MADEQYGDPKNDPGKNDDSQPSVTTVEQVLRMADERAGVKPPETPVPAEETDVEAAGEEDTEDTGSGPFESRTAEQLRNAARAKGLAGSGSKDELVERLRG